MSLPTDERSDTVKVVIVGGNREPIAVLDTGLVGMPDAETERGYVLPFSSFENAIDCWRIVQRQLEREINPELGA